jgi:cytochrome c553
MKNVLVTAVFLGLGLMAVEGRAIEQGDPARGEQLSSACGACHGADGNSTNPQFPRIADQYPDYIVQALKAYKSGDRKNAIMAGIASGLSEQDMQDLAAYFSRQQGDLYQMSVL